MLTRIGTATVMSTGTAAPRIRMSTCTNTNTYIQHVHPHEHRSTDDFHERERADHALNRTTIAIDPMTWSRTIIGTRAPDACGNARAGRTTPGRLP